MPCSSPRRSPLAALALLAALLAPASASADSVVTELANDTPIAAYGGALAWSAYDASTDRFALVIRQGGVTAPARTATARRGASTSASGRTPAGASSRCTRAVARRPRGCDVYRYDLRTRRQSKLRSVSSPSFDEAWPAQWRGRIAFARRARTRVISGYDHRPDPRRRGPVLDCDIPYVKTLASRAPSRRLDRSPCGATAGIAIRGATIVHVSGVSSGRRGIGVAGASLLRASGGAAACSPAPAAARAASARSSRRTCRRRRSGSRAQASARRSRRASCASTCARGALTTVAREPQPRRPRRPRRARTRFWYVQGPEPDLD